MGTIVLNGLPDKLSHDGWWLIGQQPDPSAIRLPPPQDAAENLLKDNRPVWMIAALAALILLADFLFWARPIGLSLAVFALACGS